MNECIRAWSTFLVNGFFGRRKQKIGFFADKTRIPDQNCCFDSKWFRFVFSWWQANCRWKVSFKKNFIIIFQSGLLWIFLKWINFLLDHNDDSHAGTFFISQFGPFNTREKKNGWLWISDYHAWGYYKRPNIDFWCKSVCARWFRQQHYGGFFLFFDGGLN